MSKGAEERLQVKEQAGVLVVSGEVSFATAMSLWKQSLALLPASGPWKFDFSAVTTVDSAGLALLLQWMRLAKKQGKQLQFQKLPQQWRSIALAAGLDKVIAA